MKMMKKMKDVTKLVLQERIQSPSSLNGLTREKLLCHRLKKLLKELDPERTVVTVVALPDSRVKKVVYGTAWRVWEQFQEYSDTYVMEIFLWRRYNGIVFQLKSELPPEYQEKLKKMRERA